MDAQTLQRHYDAIRVPEPLFYPQQDLPVLPESTYVKMEPIVAQPSKDQEQQISEEVELVKVDNEELRETVMTDLFVKYLGNDNEKDVEHLLNKADEIRIAKRWRKDEILLLPAVFYCEYIDAIKLSLIQFCQRNNLPVKAFVKRYKACKYHKGENVGTTCRPETPSRLRGQADMSIQRAVQLIYDYVFLSQYLQKHRREVIKSLSDRLQEIDSRILKEMEHIKGSLKTYYLMFEFLWEMNMRIPWPKFKKSVSDRLGLHLSTEQRFKTKKLFEKYRYAAPSEDESAQERTS